MSVIIRDKNFYKQAAAIIIPVAAQNVITMGVNLMDTVMLGSFGEYQLSASSLANQFINLFQILCMGMGCGAAVVTAQLWGKKDIEGLRRVVTLMLRIAVVLSLLFTLVTFLFPGQIMRIYTSDSQVIGYGIRYFKYLQVVYICQALALTLTQVLRSVKIVQVSMFTSMASFFVNIFFNWVFIFGKLGAPRMEIEGAALGTLIARVFEMSCIFGYVVLRDKKIGYRLRMFWQPCGDVVKDFIKYSIPVLISDMILGFGNNALSVVMGHIGPDFVAAASITTVTLQVSTFCVMGVASAGSTIVGNTIGAGKKREAYCQGATFLLMSVILGFIGCGLILLTRTWVIGMYNITENTSYLASQMTYAIAVIVIFRSVSSVMTKGVLRGGGDTRFLMVADILFLWVFSIPLGALAGLVWHFPVFWIYFLLMGDNVIKSIWCIHRLLSGKWIQVI